jgi:hypothetical protein
MRPSSRQLIESIQWELETRVAPEVHGDWARSSLRSVAALLTHLAARVDVEVELLVADNADLRATVGEVAPLLDPTAVVLPEPSRSHLVTELVAENEALRELAELALRTFLERGAADAVDKVAGCLRRQLERERPLVTPAFTGPIF